MKLRILSEADCRSVLDMAAAIDVQAEAFSLLAQGRSVEGLRSLAPSDDPPGVAIFNPCFLRGGLGYGVKVISDFYDNDRRGALFDGATGHPTTILEAGYLTDLRTGAGTGLAARHLARPDSRRIAIFGAGRVARNQLAALAQVFEIEKVDVVTRSATRGNAFVAAMRAAGGRIPPDIALNASPEDAVRSADIVVAATTAQTPVFDGRWLKAGTFVAAAGAHLASAREVDSETIRRAAVRVIDSRADCLDKAGDLLSPIGEGVLRRDDVLQIAEIVDGTRHGRRSADEITYYKSSGVPIQDIVTAQHMARAAEQRGIGVQIEIGGDGL
jgi:ornithine cyclodeaminase